MALATATAAPGIQMASPNTTPAGNVPAAGLIPFRKATQRKVELSNTDSVALTTALQPFNRVLEGTGYLESIQIEVIGVCAGNAAAVAFVPDGPAAALTSIVLKDVGPDLINVSGFNLELSNQYGGYGFRDLGGSIDTLISSMVVGAVATGGSFRVVYRIPVALNARSLMGVLGNQDRAVKYELRSDLNAASGIYATLPTALPVITINRTLHYCTVPSAVGPRRQPQQQLPPHYGVVHTLMELRSEANPVTASTVNHYLRSLGNTIRAIILVFRDSNNLRTDAMLPTRITFRVGSDAVFSESSAHRRQVMFDQFGFDSPAGVLVYNFCSDFGPFAGYELGDDWLDTRDVANAQFECSYPTFGNSPGSLTIITDSVIIPEGMNVSSLV